LFCATNTQQNNVKTPHLHISIDKIGKYNKYLIYRVFYCFHFLLYDYIFRIENLYFVGFYVLLLFDIVLTIQVENLTAITESEQTMAAYLQNSFFSAGYLMAASIVALKCINLVPDLAAWMIPEGDTAFSTRNFGEGVAQQAKVSTQGMISKVL
jgi:hypothetical protein